MRIFDQLNHAGTLTWGALALTPIVSIAAAVLLALSFRGSRARVVSMGSSIVLGTALVGVGLGVLNALQTEAQRMNHVAFRPDLAPFADQLVQGAKELLAWSGGFGAAAAVLCVLALIRTRRFSGGSVRNRRVMFGIGVVAAASAVALVGAGWWALASASASVEGAVGMMAPDQKNLLLATAPAHALKQCAAWIQWAVPFSGLAAMLVGWSFVPVQPRGFEP